MKILNFLARPFLGIGRWMRKHWILTIFIVVIVIVVGGFVYQRSRPKIEILKFTEVKKGKLVKTLSVSGVVDAKQKAVLRFAAGGKLTYLGAKEGDVLKKWQTLARIDSADLQKRMAQDLNTYFNERLDFEQSKDDRGDTITSQEIGRMSQKDQKNLENAVLGVEIREIAIRNTVLATPIEGVLVTTPTAVSGVNLTPTDTFEVIDPNSLVFKAAIDEADIALVKRGQMGSIELDAYPDTQVSATVSAIAYRSSLSSKGTVFVVELPIINDYQYPVLERYRLGMNGDVDLVVDEKDNTLYVPIEAVTQRDDKSFVRKKTGENSAEEVEIKPGIETDTELEVLSGLSQSDQVVIPE